MKRRTFLTTTGVVGVAMGTGIASTTGLTFSASPWRQFSGLKLEEINHLDGFAKELKHNLSLNKGDLKIAQNVVMPKEIIYQNHANGNYCLIYKNKNGKYIQLRKKAKKVTTSISIDQPTFG